MDNFSKKIVGEVAVAPQIIKKITNLKFFQEQLKSAGEKNISEMLEIIIAGAIGLGVSDIHFEPGEQGTKMRMRIDGIMYDIFIFSQKQYEKLNSRIKLLGGMKLNVNDRPQDGRFTILSESPKERILMESRISTLPLSTSEEETIVIRILNPQSLIKLEELGARKDLYELFKKEIAKPNGMILVTGPTGSGKTTTLYAFLKSIQTPEVKIITIEDPIEYHLPGITQTQVDPARGYDFANGLRAIVRQDPDVILVGEIRDFETASISLQASLTGHLLFSTLHTNDAAGAVARLKALGEKSANIASAVNMIIAQRLLRKVCKKCAKLQTIPSELFEKFKKAIANAPKDFIPSLSLNQSTKIPIAQGCEECNFTGYKGRFAVFEAFVVDEKMENFILSSPSALALKEFAIKNGMITMYQDGIFRVLEGTTTYEEVKRVVGED